MEDDITASVVLPRASSERSRSRVSQRERQAGGQLRDACCFSGPTMRSTADSTRTPRPTSRSPGTFLSNFEPLDVGAGCRRMVDNVVEFDKYHRTDEAIAAANSSEHPRTRVRGLVGASPHGGRQPVEESALSAEAARSGESARYLSGGDRDTRLAREIPADKPVHFPVNAVLAGRRNNPPDPKTGIAAAGRLQSRSTTRNCRSCSWISSAA